MKFASRTGARPFTRTRTPGGGPGVPATAEFGAMLRIMQEHSLDLLARFYGGATLTYDESVSQKIIMDVGKRAAAKANVKMGDGRAAEIVRKIVVDEVTDPSGDGQSFPFSLTGGPDGVDQAAVDDADAHAPSVVPAGRSACDCIAIDITAMRTAMP